MKVIKKQLIFISVLMFFSIITFNTTYAYFDSLFVFEHEVVLVGDWVELDAIANEETVTEIITDINSSYDIILYRDNEREIINVQPYLEQVYYDQDTGSVILDEVFQTYTNEDIVNSIDNYVSFAENFLVLDETDPSNPILVFPDATLEVPYIPIQDEFLLLPGESIALDQVIATANMQQLITNNNAQYGVTFSITMSLPGVDISDFAIEILIDKNAFNDSEYFEYMYQFLDKNDIEFSKSKVQVQKANLLDLLSTNTFQTEVRDTSIQYYHHEYPIPPFSGRWGRFNICPYIYLNSPSTYVASNSTNVVGMIMQGSCDGSKITMNFSVESVRSIDGYIPIIPIQIILSRGISTINPNQENIMPNIQYKVLGYKLS